MKTDRLGYFLILAAGALALGACHHARDLSDSMLTQLLRAQASAANDPAAPLDESAVNCLKAWSGDADIMKTLPPASSGDAAKTSCRPKVDGFLADATRNPDKVSFADVTTPATVRQAMALLAGHKPVAARLPSAADRPPTAMLPANQAAAPADTGPVDLGTAVAAVDELDSYCEKAKQASSAGGADAMVSRYASYCDKRNEQLRTRISMMQTHGSDSRQAQMFTDNVQRQLALVRETAARLGQAAPPPKKR